MGWGVAARRKTLLHTQVRRQHGGQRKTAGIFTTMTEPTTWRLFPTSSLTCHVSSTRALENASSPVLREKRAVRPRAHWQGPWQLTPKGPFRGSVTEAFFLEIRWNRSFRGKPWEGMCLGSQYAVDRLGERYCFRRRTSNTNFIGGP